MATDSSMMNSTPPTAQDKMPLPIFPPDFFDVKKNSIEYICMIVLSTMGMGSVEWNMFGITKDEGPANAVRMDLYQILNLISEMENASTGKNGFSAADVAKFAKKLVKDIQKLFGSPGKTGDLAKFDAAMKASGQDSSGVDGMVQSLKEALDGAFDSDGEGTTNFTKIPNFVEGIVNGTITASNSNLKTDLIKFSQDWWHSANPSSKDSWTGGNPFSTWGNSSQAAQQSAQGVGSMFQALIQQDTTELSSYDQIGQQVDQVAAQLKKAIADNYKNTK